MNSFIKGLGDTVGIVGMGVSGQSAADLIKHIEPSKKILTFDSKPGVGQYSDLDQMLSENHLKTLVVSPGVPLSLPSLQKASRSGVRITSELAVASSCLMSEKIIGITGSVGKSTTTAVLEKALQVMDPTAVAVGNIGKPLAEYVLEVLTGRRQRATWLAMELSSYQLENYENLSAEYSMITFFTSNHLERYDDLQHYYGTKWTLVNKTKKAVFLNAESPDLVKFAKKFPDSKLKFCSPNDPELKSFNLKDSKLLGSHNQQNLALVAHFLLTQSRGSSALEAVKSFPGLSHRLENLGVKDGIRFVNDSKATALDSVYIAASSLAAEVPKGNFLYVLIGGKDKNLPWSWLSNLKSFPNIKPIYFGACGAISKAGISIEGPLFPKLGPAIEEALKLAKPGDTVLLSPGGTSWDEFKNFEERGDYFRKICLG